MQALCQSDVQGDARDADLESWFIEQDAPEAATAYAGTLVRAVASRRREVDASLSSAATRWDLARIGPVERNIMRIAVVEMTGVDVPPKVAINEAVDIAREYGGADSPRFVNGILDQVMKVMRGDTI
jgi:N utilization substance protein B